MPAYLMPEYISVCSILMFVLCVYFFIERYMYGTGSNIASLHICYHVLDITIWYDPDDLLIACLLGALLDSYFLFCSHTKSASIWFQSYSIKN